MEPNPISTSRFITQAGKKTPAGGQGERRRIDIPILPCLLHWPPTLSHIIAADTEKTNDSHVGNMGPVEGEGGGERGDAMTGSCVLMGHKMYCTSLTSALTVTRSSQTLTAANVPQKSK